MACRGKPGGRGGRRGGGSTGGLGAEGPLVVGPPLLLLLSKLSIAPFPVSVTSLSISDLVSLAAMRKSRVAVLMVAQRCIFHALAPSSVFESPGFASRRVGLDQAPVLLYALLVLAALATVVGVWLPIGLSYGPQLGLSEYASSSLSCVFFALAALAALRGSLGGCCRLAAPPSSGFACGGILPSPGM